MAPAAIGTLAVTVLLVAGLALYLILIAAHLAKISAALDTVHKAVEGVADQVKPAPAALGAIATDVGAIQGAMHGLIALATAPPPAATAAAPPGGRKASPARATTARPAPPADPPPVSVRRLASSRAGARPNLPPPLHRRP